MNKNNFLFSILIFVPICYFISCTTHKDEWGAKRWDVTEKIHLKGERIIIDKLIYTEDELVFVNEYIIFGNKDGQKQFSIFENIEDSLKFKGSFFTLGKGPLEAQAAEIFYLQNDSLLAIVGYNPRGKTFFIPLGDIENCQDKGKWYIAEYEFIQSYTFDMIPISDSTCVMQTADNNNEMIKVLNTDSRSVFQTNIYYPKDNNNLSFLEKSMLYAGDIRKRPSSNQFVYSNMSSKYSFIFTLNVGDFQNEDCKTVFYQIPLAVSEGDRLRYTRNHESGYQLSVSDKYIYFADPKIDYMEREKSIARNGYPPGYVTEIYVSDWEGNPKCKYILDRPVCYLQPNIDDSFLWAFYQEPDSLEPQIVRYELPKI